MTRALFALAGAALFLLACDPVHSNEIDALGGETPGVRTGPNHRPGQPCLLCHDGKIGDPRQFSIAGTVFVNPYDKVAASGATIIMTDANNVVFTTTTNQAGNFYVTPSQWTPAYPMTVEVDYQRYQTKMRSHIGRDGSCSGCHFDPAGFDSPGHVAVAYPDGGVP